MIRKNHVTSRHPTFNSNIHRPPNLEFLCRRQLLSAYWASWSPISSSRFISGLVSLNYHRCHPLRFLCLALFQHSLLSSACRPLVFSTPTSSNSHFPCFIFTMIWLSQQHCYWYSHDGSGWYPWSKVKCQASTAHTPNQKITCTKVWKGFRLLYFFCLNLLVAVFQHRLYTFSSFPPFPYLVHPNAPRLDLLLSTLHHLKISLVTLSCLAHAVSLSLFSN